MTSFVRNLIIGGALFLVEAITVVIGEKTNGLPDLRKLKSREERRLAVEAYRATLRESEA